MGHKRVLGKTTDFITGREITDTDDERYRQKIARILVEEKGYLRKDLEVKRRFKLNIEDKEVFSMADLVVNIDGTSFMVLRYGPGSLVTRERPALAVSRILEPYQIPVTVVTNGEDAEIMDTASGRVVATGIESIPSKKEIMESFKMAAFTSLSERQIEVEKKILYAYDWLEHSLECDDDWCAPE